MDIKNKSTLKVTVAVIGAIALVAAGYVILKKSSTINTSND